MPEKQTDFLCLRCGHSEEGVYDPKKPQELTCAKCRSNSVRPVARKARPRVVAKAS